MARVLFLDFDGVLHPVGAKPGESLPFEWLPELAALLSSTPDVALAVHSSWVERYPVDELREFLGPLGCRFIGAVDPGAKAPAIQAFLRSRPDIDHWLVVDDDQREFPIDFQETLVICDPLRGITDPGAQDQIRRWLLMSSKTVDQSD